MKNKSLPLSSGENAPQQKTEADQNKESQAETICDCEPEMTDDFFENVQN